MKRSWTVVMFLLLSALAANAQQQCDTEAVTALYNKFLADYNGTAEQQKAANETGKQYISKYGECPTEEEKKIANYIKNWLADYPAMVDERSCTTAVDKTPGQAFQLCAPHLARDPKNLRAYLQLSLAGIKTLQTGDRKLKDETVKAARKALDLIKTGRKVDRWVLADDKDEAAATLEFHVAYLTIDTTPSETATAMLALARSTTSYSKDPSTYFYLGRAIHESEAKKLLEAYKRDCGANESTPECDAAFTKIESVIDRVIDAYARAVAISSSNREYARIAAAAKPKLAEVYKTRHDNSDAGLDKLVSEILAKPLP